MKWITIVSLVVVLGGVAWWMVGSGRNLPGETIVDQGREHWEHAKLDGFKYNSNPPVSGPHDPDWIRPGIYGEMQDKYKLLHSLEHGYIEIQYNCALALSSQPSVLSVSAHEDNGVATDSGTVKTDCALGQTLGDFAKKMTLFKIIVMPNPTIDKPIIMAAWDRILKMDTWDEKLAEKFVKAFRNKGPEQTME